MFLCGWIYRNALWDRYLLHNYTVLYKRQYYHYAKATYTLATMQLVLLDLSMKRIDIDIT